MSLLEFDRVDKFFGHGVGSRVALREVSLRIEPGESVAVWGRRRSGRSTLLRVAAGIERPDAGIVRFEGHDLGARRSHVLGSGIAYCRKTFRASEGELVLDHLTIGQLARGVSPSDAWKRAREALETADCAGCASRRPTELDGAETMHVAIARAIALRPRLLLVDEPTIGVELRARDRILLLLDSLAEDGMAVLRTTGESACLTGCRPLMISEGELRGASAGELAPVVPLRKSA
jgi:ABC-type sugar transport system ATPase subunit